MSSIAKVRQPNSEEVEDPCQSQWINLLPPLRGRDVLKIGTTRLDIVRALQSVSDGRLVCVGAEQLPETLAQIPRFDSLRSVPDGLFDVAVLDEYECLRSGDFPLEEVCARLRDGGYLLVCLPPGLAGVRLRQRVKSRIVQAGFDRIQQFLCEPDAKRPVRIIEVVEEHGWTARFLSKRPYWALHKWRAGAKAAVKRFVFAAAGGANPLFGSILLARRPGTVFSAECWPERTERVTGRNIARSSVVLTAQPGNAKQLLFVYDAASSEMLAVGKIARRRYADADLLERKYHNRALAQQAEYELGEKKVRVPRLLDQHLSNRTTWYVIPGLEGELRTQAIECLVQRSRTRLRTLLLDAVDVAVTVGRELTRKISEPVDKLDPAFLENYLSLPLAAGATRDWPISVQHGDFTSENLFFDEGAGWWNVIDWEWLASGYPPLFDVFTMFRSIAFVNKNGGRGGHDSEFVLSIEDTFFRKNWFSDMVREALGTTCAAAGIDTSRAYEYFLLFLLVRCNRLRLDENWRPDQLRNWEAATRLAIENRERFVF